MAALLGGLCALSPLQQRNTYDAVRKMSADDIVKSLRPGAENPLKVGADGRIFDGNTRILVLEERGFDINSLPRVPYP
jgi:hypothetical protein